jgi:ATP-binding cassette subfamily A (ABC1) protein 1
MPFTSHQAGLLDAVKALQAVLFIMIAFAFVPGGIVVFVVREKELHHNSKHQQMISGARVVSFWLSSFAFDMLTYMIPWSLSILSIIWVDLSQLVDNGALFACCVLLLGYGLSITSCTYALSFLFDKHTQAQIIVVLFNVFLGLVLMIAQFVMAQVDDTQYVNELLMPVYRLSPGFCLGHGLWTLTTSSLLAEFMGGDADAMGMGPLSLPIAGTDCIFLYSLAVFYLLLTLAIDTLKSRPKYAAKFASKFQVRELAELVDAPYDIDADVAAEAARVEGSAVGSVPDELVRLVRLRKVYRGPSTMFRSEPSRPKVAVRSMSFGLNVGECFGYLGINGAGKTTTMKILTGEILATSGKAHLGGHDIETEQECVRRLIGYCPQFDALLDRVTVKEHLELFGRLKGLRDEALDEAVASVTDMLSLTKFSNKLAGTLSGGNKRKLSVGIALIGGPKILFLDEPSTGVDPVARRFMWAVISRICTRQRDCCIILTSHVMEEVEALCTKVAVVVGGRMRCIGSNQHLKSRFGGSRSLMRAAHVPHHSTAICL